MSVWRVSWWTFRYLCHEKSFYLVVGFGVLSTLLSLLLGELSYTQQADIRLNFMLGFMELVALLFAAVLGVRLFQQDTLKSQAKLVLSHGIPRTKYLLGRYFGLVLCLGIVLFGMATFGISVHYFFSAQWEAYWIYLSSLFLFLQMSVIVAVACAASMCLGPVLSAATTLVFYAMGHLHHLGKISSTGTGSEVSNRILFSFIPNLEIFNLKNSLGAAVFWEPFGWVLFYTLSCVGLLLFMAGLLFQRRDLI